MGENEAHVWIAVVGMIGSILASVIAAIGTYLAQRAKRDVRQDISAVKHDLAYNTQKTDNTNQIVNGQRDAMILKIADLEKQLNAVNVVLALERKVHPEVAKVVERVATAVEAVKE